MNLFIFLLSMMLSCIPNKQAPEVSDVTKNTEPIECGYFSGDYACGFTYFDQHGDEVSLYDFKGKVILLDFSTTWCYYCNVAAAEEAEFSSKYPKGDFVWITVLLQNDDGERPSCSNLKSWADKYNIESPVLSGEMDILDMDGEGEDEGYSCIGFPTFVIIDKNMLIEGYMIGWGKERISEKIEELLQK